MIVTDITQLKQVSIEVKPEEIKDIVKQLEDNLKGQRGIGLTAIQIGIPKRVSIIRILGKDPMDLYNAKITEKIDPIKFKELCLSIPGLAILTRRYNNITFENGDGQIYSADGIEAIVVQHEIDHCNGILMLDRKWKKRGKK